MHYLLTNKHAELDFFPLRLTTISMRSCAGIFWSRLAVTRLLPILISCGWVAALAHAENVPINGVYYGSCIHVRQSDQECERDSLDSTWRCTKESHLNMRDFGFGICLSGEKDTRPTCECGKQCGPEFRQPDVMWETDPSTGATGKLVCDWNTLRPERETVPNMPFKYTHAASFTLPKEKFPQCLAVRIQTHECLRFSVFSDWICSRRTASPDPIATCLVWDSFTYPCATNGGWPIIGYVTINIDPTSHAVEPALRCIYDHSGFQPSWVLHFFLPDWNDRSFGLNYPQGWRNRATEFPPYFSPKASFALSSRWPEQHR